MAYVPIGIAIDPQTCRTCRPNRLRLPNPGSAFCIALSRPWHTMKRLSHPLNPSLWPGDDTGIEGRKNPRSRHSPGGYSLTACLVAEVVLTFMFLMIILGSTDRRAPQGFAPIPIGLGLTLIHLIGIPVTNLSENPARSTGPALFVGGWAVEQLWLFWLAPVVGAAIAGIVYPAVFGEGFPPY